MVKDGYKFAAAPLLLGAIVLGIHWYWLGGVLILLGIFVLFFFRDPEGNYLHLVQREISLL